MTSPAGTTSQPADERISYPTHADGEWVFGADGIRVCESYRVCFGPEVRSRRIAAALNATQYIPTGQLEQIDHKTKRLLPMEVGRTIPIKLMPRSPSDELKYVQDVNLKLLAVNAELLAALRGLLAVTKDSGLGIFNAEFDACATAEAAITKAEELTRG